MCGRSVRIDENVSDSIGLYVDGVLELMRMLVTVLACMGTEC